MRAIRAFICCVILIASSLPAAAQTRSSGAIQPSQRLFERLFRECRGCGGRRGTAHMVIDSARLTDEWLARHTVQANGGSFGDNAVVADFWYDAVHRRLFTRSLVLHEVDDPADLRLGRAPGRFPDAPDFEAELEPDTAVGHIGFVRWSDNGFGAYFAAMQGAVRDKSTGYLDLSTVTGTAGRTRTGAQYASDELVKHVRLHPTGQLDVGYDTSPDARPDISLLVRGNVAIEGNLTVAGEAIRPVPATPAPTCSVRTLTGRGRTASAACEAGEIATSGGGTCAAGELRASRPTVSGAMPTGWELACSRDGSHRAYVICCAR